MLQPDKRGAAFRLFSSLLCGAYFALSTTIAQSVDQSKRENVREQKRNFARGKAGRQSIKNDAISKEQSRARREFYSFEFELDSYYSSVGSIISLSDKPIQEVGETSEFSIYRELFSDSLYPRYLYLEGSAYPVPIGGAFFRNNYPEAYEQGQTGYDVHVIRAATSGYEEPYAGSIFMGNVMRYNDPKRIESERNLGYMGYVFSAGGHHIQDNKIVDDVWYEFEWKLKGDQNLEHRRLSWSFRIGSKIHQNPNIADVFYLALERSRLDFAGIDAFSILRNSGFEYVFDMKTSSFKGIRHLLLLERKWPWPKFKVAFSLAVGVLWEANEKYSGKLARQRQGNNFEVLIRPNIEF